MSNMLYWAPELNFCYFGVSFSPIVRLQVLPGQFALYEVNEAKTYGFQVVSSALFNTQMGI